MDDIIDEGEERGSRRWPAVLAAMTIAAVLAVGVARELPRHPHSSVRPTATTHTSRNFPLANTGTAGSARHVQLAGLGEGAARLLGHAPAPRTPAARHPHRAGSPTAGQALQP
jgi:hypothetical protein